MQGTSYLQGESSLSPAWFLNFSRLLRITSNYFDFTDRDHVVLKTKSRVFDNKGPYIITESIGVEVPLQNENREVERNTLNEARLFTWAPKASVTLLSNYGRTELNKVPRSLQGLAYLSEDLHG